MLPSFMDSFVVESYLIPVLLILMFFDFLMHKCQFWAQRKIAGPEPHFLLGNMSSFFPGESKIFEAIKTMYRDWKYEPHFGIFINRTPILIVNNLDEINSILTDNNELFSSPEVFSTKKIKNCDHLFKKTHLNSKFCGKFLKDHLTDENVEKMFGFMLKCAHFHEISLENQNNKIDDEQNEIVDFSAFSEKFVSDVITSCIFGVDVDEYVGADLEFRDIIRGLFIPFNRDDPVAAVMKKILKFFGYETVSHDVEFFVDLIGRKIKGRERGDVSRPDFIDILKSVEKNDINSEWFNSMLTSQVLFFLVSGYKASCSLVNSAFRELAINQEIQEKLRTEVVETLQICDGKLSYAVVENMEYISMVLKETLRKHPPIPLLRRKLMQNQRVGKTEIYIPKGTQIVIPVWSIHHDENYYPDPHTFDPVRFSKEEMEKRHPMSFLAYGGSSNKCCGDSFSFCVAKLALITVLKNFKIGSINNESGNETTNEEDQKYCFRLIHQKLN